MSDKLPIKMLHDRLLVEVDEEIGERRSAGGIVIPATAGMGARRLVWSRVVAAGPHARTVQVDDRVLFVLAWAIALAVWRFGRIEERWSSDLVK